jgi:hypothetical protein
MVKKIFIYFMTISSYGYLRLLLPPELLLLLLRELLFEDLPEEPDEEDLDDV